MIKREMAAWFILCLVTTFCLHWYIRPMQGKVSHMRHVWNHDKPNHAIPDTITAEMINRQYENMMRILSASNYLLENRSDSLKTIIERMRAEREDFLDTGWIRSEKIRLQIESRQVDSDSMEVFPYTWFYFLPKQMKPEAR